MIRKDKQLHAIVGFAIGFATGYATAMTAPGIIAAAIAGWGKELWDRQHPEHTYDPWDAHATILGGIVGSALGSLFRLTISHQ